jgi:hypothetical protein
MSEENVEIVRKGFEAWNRDSMAIVASERGRLVKGHGIRRNRCSVSKGLIAYPPTVLGG